MIADDDIAEAGGRRSTNGLREPDRARVHNGIEARLEIDDDRGIAGRAKDEVGHPPADLSGPPSRAGGARASMSF